MKLCLFALVFLDSQMVLECNLRTYISVPEFAWELPHSTALWESATAEEWAEAARKDVSQSPTVPAQSVQGYAFGLTTRGNDIKSLMIATQRLMSNDPSGNLLQALSRCRFGLLCVASNLQMLVRGFTECYYQLPPNLADPSAFHILTQSQNRQVNTALKHLANLASSDLLADQHLDRAVRLTIWSTRISLCKPSELLIHGVTDAPVHAGLAIAAHSALGSYDATRRAAVGQFSQRRFGDDGILCILDDMLKAWVEFNSPTEAMCLQEAPWVTTSSFRVSLTLWRTLRACVSEVTKQFDSVREAPGRFDPAKVALIAISNEIRRFRVPIETEREPHSRLLLPEDLSELENDFVTTMIQACNRRSASPIGPALAAIMEEIRALDPSEFQLAGVPF